MRSKIAKVLGVVVAFATLASLLVGTAVPASAAPGALAWGATSTPSAVGKVLTAGISISKIAAAADGKTVFAWDDAATTGRLMYKSTNGGNTWGTGVGITATGNAIALEVSPNFATDGVVAIAFPGQVFLSQNGGTSYAEVTLDLTAKLEGGTLTSMDIGYFFTAPTTYSIVLGVTGGTGAISNTLIWSNGGFSWAELGNLTGTTGLAVQATATATIGAATQATAVSPAPVSGAIPLGSIVTNGGTLVGGTGYPTAPTVTFSGGGATTQATATATVAGGVVTAITVATGGVGYTGTPTIAIGAPAAGSVVTGFAGLPSGSGYLTAPAVAISGGGGTGAAGTAVLGALGVVASITLTNTGSGYTTAPTVTIGAPGNVGNVDVLAVMFSPSHTTDAEIMAVYTDGIGTFLSSHYGGATLGWNAFLLPCTIVTPGVPARASIAVGSDYVGNTGAAILVGLSGTGTATKDSIYRITLRAANPGVAANLAATTGLGLVQQVTVGGTTAAGTVLWTTNGSGLISRATGGTSGFTAATISKAPTAATQAWIAWGGTTAFASESGAGGGVYRSLDSGVSFDGVGLLDVGTVANMSMVNMTVVDANTIFLVMGNATAGYPARSVFKTADAGASWVRILAGANLSQVVASPSYATDTTFLVIDGSNIINKSVNGGSVFTQLAVPTLAGQALMVDGTNFFVGGVTTGELYKSGRFANATGITGVVYSIALNPKDTTKATIAIGTTTGTVYQSTNDGVSFTIVGTGAIGAGATLTTVAYGTDGTLYAADAVTGVYRWTGTAWLALQAGTISGLFLSADNSLYASSSTAGVSVYRSLKPTATTAALAEVQQLNYTGSAFPGAATIADMQLFSAATANTLYILDTAVAQTSYGFNGGIYGFSDSLIVAAAKGTPADKALLTTTTTATIAWTAITGATSYAYILDGAAEVTTTAGAVSVALTGFTPGSTHTWSYRVTAPLFSKPSATVSFTVALSVVNPQPVPENPDPALGATDVPVDTTFTWPAVAGATGYEFVIAEDLGETDKFAIIDYSATTPTNAHKLRENLKYDTVYWWRVRPFNATTKGDWSVFFFTTQKAPLPPTTTSPPIIVTEVPPPQISLEIPPSPVPVNVIPPYLLWAVIGVGAVLIIVVIVLIVRTRRIS